jgi:hypothetical protein
MSLGQGTEKVLGRVAEEGQEVWWEENSFSFFFSSFPLSFLCRAEAEGVAVCRLQTERGRGR